MKITVDRLRALEGVPKTLASDAPHVTHALRVLARFTFPGLEPSSGFTTGYSRTREGLGLPQRGGLEALHVLCASGYAMRIGRKGWCITKKGRDFARPIFGDECMAREELAEGESFHQAAFARRVLVEGKGSR